MSDKQLWFDFCMCRSVESSVSVQQKGGRSRQGPSQGMANMDVQELVSSVDYYWAAHALSATLQ